MGKKSIERIRIEKRIGVLKDNLNEIKAKAENYGDIALRIKHAIEELELILRPELKEEEE